MEKAIFHGEMADLMNRDSHWPKSGSRTFTTDEMNTFIGHLWEYFNEHSFSLNELALTMALLNTSRMESAQDRAKKVIEMLKT